MNCLECLCRVCTKAGCPRGAYHCLPCHSGTVLDCDFFIHKKVSKIYRLKVGECPAYVWDRGSLRASLEYEQLRHRQRVKAIIQLYKNRK